MHSDLERLKITEREVESLTGLDIDQTFVGGALSGAYRPLVFRRPKGRLTVLVTELIVAGLAFALMVPIGLFLVRGNIGGIQAAGAIAQFLLMTLSLAALVMLARYTYMRLIGKRLKSLMHLLDEVDRYNDMMQAIVVSEQLAVAQSETQLTNRQSVLEALALARGSLVCGLAGERILRENRGLLMRQRELLANIESNLVALQALETTRQASDYRQLLDEALQIGASVYQELQKVTVSNSSL
jgi:hypothetical protein